MSIASLELTVLSLMLSFPQRVVASRSRSRSAGQPAVPLLRLPEILFFIGQHLLLKKGVDQEDIRSLRCTAKRLASALRPLTWASHFFAPECTGLKESTKQLARDKRLQSYVRHAEWQLPAMLPISTLLRLKNLKIIRVVQQAAPSAPLSRLPRQAHLALKPSSETPLLSCCLEVSEERCW